MNNELNIQDGQAKYQAIFDSAVDGIITISERGIIESINKAGAKLFGFEKEEVLGQNVKMLMPTPFTEKHDSYLKNYLDTGIKKIIGIGREVKGRRKDLSIFPFRLSVAEVKLKDKRIFTGIIHDISDRYLAEEIKLALDKEIELNQLKSNFVSMASHEFRTPLTSILTSITLIEKYQKSDEQYKRNKHIKRIKDSVENLTGILNEFLSVSKLEEGKVSTNFNKFSVPEFLHEVIEEVSLILKPGQFITYKNLGDQQSIYSDKKILLNILLNIFSNAIKYSPNNSEIICKTKIDNKQLSIQIKDTGIGIPIEEQKHLFERFFRAENASTIQGTGLGLHITKKYLNLLLGTIEISSKHNTGTSVIINIPIKESED